MISYWTCPLTKLGEWKAGGMNVYILNLAYQIGKLGHTVDIYTHTHHPAHQPIAMLDEKVRIIHLYRLEKDIYKGAKNFSGRLYFYISRNKLQYDIIHAHYYLSGLVGINLRGKIDIPLVSTFHSLGIMKKKYAHINDEKRINAEIRIMHHSDAIVASSITEKRDMMHYYGGKKQKIYILPPGVNHTIFKPFDRMGSRIRLGLENNAKIILFVGRIDPIKGIYTLIQTIPALVEDPILKRQLKVLIVGGDIKSHKFWQQKEMAVIMKIIHQKNLDKYIQFIGSQPQHLLPYYYSASDTVVVPSSYETFGLVALEAMACGAAVVATSAGGLGYLISDTINGRLVKSPNSTLFSGVLMDVLADDKMRKRLGDKARETSQKYCWDKQAKHVISLYKKVL